jgi:hypothetical protein
MLQYPRAQQPSGGNGISQSWNSVAAVVAVVATFFITPIFYQMTVGLVRQFAATQIAPEFAELASFGWGIISIFLIYWVSNLLAHEFIIERGIKKLIR